MRRFILLFILFSLSVIFVDIFLFKLGGYVLFVFREWTIQIPLWLTALLTFFLFTALYFLLRFIFWSINLSSHVRRWLKKRRVALGQIKLRRGIFSLLLNNLEDAQKKLLHAEKESRGLFAFSVS